MIVPRPDRIRQIGAAGFGWLDARLRSDGWLQLMAPTELAVYAVLCLVGNRQGVSWYRKGRLCAMLALPQDELCVALRRLRELDLVAYQPFQPDGSEGFHQVLSLPDDTTPSR